MRLRNKPPRSFGIRPHVFHIWADHNIAAVELQHRRLLDDGVRVQPNWTSQELKSALDASFRQASIDFQFYFVAMRRLLRTAETAIPEGYGGPTLKAAIKEFKARIPGLVQVRDAGEHPDHLLITGRTYSSSMGLGGGLDATFSHGDNQFQISKTTDAARALYRALKDTVPPGAPNRIVKHLGRGEPDRAIAEATWVASPPGRAPSEHR